MMDVVAGDRTVLVEGPTDRGTFFVRTRSGSVWNGRKWIGFGVPKDFLKFMDAVAEARKAEKRSMTPYRAQVLRTVQLTPGAGALNVCDYGGGSMEPIDIHNAERALKWLRDNGWLDANNYVTEQGERYLAAKAVRA